MALYWNRHRLWLLVWVLVFSACSSPKNTAPGPYAAGPVLWSDSGEGRVITQAVPSGNVYLSDLSWLSATNGWGPVERDQSNGETAQGDGRPITLNGVVFSKGLGAHAPSDILNNLGGNCTRFRAAVGLDDEVDHQTEWGSVIFRVLADGVLLFDSSLMRGSSPTQTVDVDVSGRQELQLIITDGGDNNYYDHADWADARLVCAEGGGGGSTPQGLTGEYFDNSNFTGTKVTRLDAQINFNWGRGSPESQIAPDTFSVRWTGQVEARFSETYTFTTRTDDGVRLWVNDQLIIDSWRNQSATNRSGRITLVAGQRYSLRMEYYESTGSAVAQLYWSSPSQAREIIPQRYLYPINVTGALQPPTDLIAVGLSENSVYLDWSGVGGATGYVVERRTGSTGTFTQVGVPIGSSFVDNGLSPGTLYTYRVSGTAPDKTLSYATTTVTTPTATGPVQGGAEARTKGVFGPVRDFPLVATHAALLPNGKVIAWYSYDRIGVYRDNQDANAPFHQSSIVTLWDPATNTFEEVNNNTTDLFCAGWAVMQDGRLLVAGGNLGTPNGSLHTNIFDPVTKTWIRGPNMRAGRWYPSVTPLPNGELLITGGQTETGANNTVHEVWQTNGSLRQLTGATTSGRDFEHYFPWMHVAPNGLVFHAGWNNTMSYLNPAGSGSWSSQTWTRQGPLRWYGSSVTYQPGRIIVLGGGASANASTTLIDLTNGVTSQAGPSMNFARTHPDATLLADGKVFVNGGNNGDLWDLASSVYVGEIWNPQTNTWTVAASAQRPRNYHSVALLLPDATVWVAGSGGCGLECQPGSGSARAGVNQLNYEVYYPPYLFDSSGSLATRPSISNVPSSIRYGQGFVIETPDAPNIGSVTLLALGASTHAFNYTQRFMALPIQSRSSTGLTVLAPANPNLAPPNYYMVFIFNQSGVPSVARIVRLEP
ncbi:NPCBM/NEW2 domain-containing protein [Meiothermus sp.]|uniref:NPCBM/NEW2 domain-containing protein n=1 Tax=Meiothermus sp. TaxID=1955249 RepID=UPI002630FA88|nr:NPCBM/NEW2 domain-containing protein [Meiothermus sp.]